MIDDILSKVKIKVESLPALPSDKIEAVTLVQMYMEKAALTGQNVDTLEEVLESLIEGMAWQVVFYKVASGIEKSND